MFGVGSRRDDYAASIDTLAVIGGDDWAVLTGPSLPNRSNSVARPVVCDAGATEQFEAVARVGR